MKFFKKKLLSRKESLRVVSNPLCLGSLQGLTRTYHNTQSKGLVKTWREDPRFRVKGNLVEEIDIFPVPLGSGSGHPVLASLRTHCCNPRQPYHFPFPTSTPGLPFPGLFSCKCLPFWFKFPQGLEQELSLCFHLHFWWPLAMYLCFISHLYIFF